MIAAVWLLSLVIGMPFTAAPFTRFTVAVPTEAACMALAEDIHRLPTVDMGAMWPVGCRAKGDKE